MGSADSLRRSVGDSHGNVVQAERTAGMPWGMDGQETEVSRISAPGSGYGTAPALVDSASVFGRT